MVGGLEMVRRPGGGGKEVDGDAVQIELAAAGPEFAKAEPGLTDRSRRRRRWFRAGKGKGRAWTTNAALVQAAGMSICAVELGGTCNLWPGSVSAACCAIQHAVGDANRLGTGAVVAQREPDGQLLRAHRWHHKHIGNGDGRRADHFHRLPHAVEVVTAADRAPG